MSHLLKYFQSKKAYVYATLFVIVFLVSVKILWDMFVGISDQQVFLIIKSYFEVYGMWLIFFAGILESILLIGNYFPGSMVIFLGVATNSDSFIKAFCVIVVAIIAMLIGYHINYFLGKYGFYKVFSKFGLDKALTKMKIKVEGKISKSYIMYFIPATGSLVSTSFGIIGYDYKTFLRYLVPAVIFWDLLWGSLVFLFGMKVFEFMMEPYVLIPLVVIMVYYIIKK